MMKLYKNESGYWCFRVPDPHERGKYHKVSTRRKVKAEAEAIVAAARADDLTTAAEIGVLSSKVVSILTRGQRKTVEGAMEDWIDAQRHRGYSENTIQASYYWVTKWANDGGHLGKLLSEIREEHIFNWVNREDSRAKANSRSTMLSMLRSFFDYCQDQGLNLGNPAALVRVDLSRLLHSQKEVEPRQPFLDQEIDLMMDKVKPGSGDRLESAFWYAAIGIGRWTGLRFSDICRLEWASFKNPGRICVWTIKRDKRVELPLEPEQLKIACDSIVRKNDVFCFPDQRSMSMIPEFYRSLLGEFKKIREACLIFDRSFHCLRHTYIVECHKAGIPMPHIAANVGHSSTRTTEGYLAGKE